MLQNALRLESSWSQHSQVYGQDDPDILLEDEILPLPPLHSKPGAWSLAHAGICHLAVRFPLVAASMLASGGEHFLGTDALHQQRGVVTEM